MIGCAGCLYYLGHQHVRKAKLNLVDLAGSERHGKVGKRVLEKLVCAPFFVTYNDDDNVGTVMKFHIQYLLCIFLVGANLAYLPTYVKANLFSFCQKETIPHL